MTSLLQRPAPAPQEPAPDALAVPAPVVPVPADVARVPGRVRVALTGDLDPAAVDRVVGGLGRGDVLVTLDLAGVERIDGPAARALLHLSFELEGRGGALRLHRPSRALKNALRYRGLGHLLVRR